MRKSFRNPWDANLLAAVRGVRWQRPNVPGGRRGRTMHRSGANRSGAMNRQGAVSAKLRRIVAAGRVQAAVMPVGACLGRGGSGDPLGTPRRGLANGAEGGGVCNGPVAYWGTVKRDVHNRLDPSGARLGGHEERSAAAGVAPGGVVACVEAHQEVRGVEVGEGACVGGARPEAGGHPARWHALSRGADQLATRRIEAYVEDFGLWAKRQRGTQCPMFGRCLRFGMGPKEDKGWVGPARPD